jgi:hypothetical protein
VPLIDSQRSFSDAAPLAAAAAQDQHYPEPDTNPNQGAVTTVVQQQPDPQQQQPDPQHQQQQQAVPPQVYSPLHYDIQKFARRIVPTDQEMAERQRIIQG